MVFTPGNHGYWSSFQLAITMHQLSFTHYRIAPSTKMTWRGVAGYTKYTPPSTYIDPKYSPREEEESRVCVLCWGRRQAHNPR